MTNVIGISGKIGSGKDTVGLIIQYLTDRYAIKDGLTYEQWLEEYINIEDGYNKSASEWEIKKFADKLKEISCMIIGCSREQLEDHSFKDTPLGPEWVDKGISLTPRQILQRLGTEGGRMSVHENIWVNALFADFRCEAEKWDEMGNTTLENYPRWILTDMRFPNELIAVEDHSGITIRVERDTELRYPELWAEYEESKHVVWDTFLIEKDVHREVYHPSETALDQNQFKYVINNNDSLEELIEHVRAILTMEGIV